MRNDSIQIYMRKEEVRSDRNVINIYIFICILLSYEYVFLYYLKIKFFNRIRPNSLKKFYKMKTQ